jgi:hypothetical protein
MKKLFTFISALLSLFAVVQMSAAADLVFNVTVPTPTYECWVAGNFNDWNNNQYKMTKVDDTHYTITIPEAELNQANITTDGGVKYKYLSGGGDWAYVEKDADGNEISDRVYTDGNDVVQKWALVYNPNVEPIPMTVTIIAQVPADVVELYIVGTFNNWTIPTDTTKMTFLEANESGKVFSATFFTVDANKLQFKFCAGPAWDYEQTQGSNYIYPDPTQNTAAVIVESFKKIYDPTKVGDVTIIATVPAGTERVWINGSHLGWNWDNLKEGTKNQDGTFTFVAEDVMAFEYRLYNWPDWGYPEVGEADPTKELPNRTGQYDPTNPANNTINITVWGWKQPAPSAVPNVFFDRYQVKTVNRTITVNNVTSRVELFDVMGRQLEKANVRGSYTTGLLTNGIYILKVDGISAKIAVK